MNDLTPQKNPTRSEWLKEEIINLEKDISHAIDAENKARRDQTWLKKRLKIAKDELQELTN
jgi:hypothetical protein